MDFDIHPSERAVLDALFALKPVDDSEFVPEENLLPKLPGLSRNAALVILKRLERAELVMLAETMGPHFEAYLTPEGRGYLETGLLP